MFRGVGDGRRARTPARTDVHTAAHGSHAFHSNPDAVAYAYHPSENYNKHGDGVTRRGSLLAASSCGRHRPTALTGRASRATRGTRAYLFPMKGRAGNSLPRTIYPAGRSIVVSTLEVSGRSTPVHARHLPFPVEYKIL